MLLLVQPLPLCTLQHAINSLTHVCLAGAAAAHVSPHLLQCALLCTCPSNHIATCTLALVLDTLSA